MEQFYRALERAAVDSEKAAGLAELAARVRELNEAVLLTDVPDAEVAEVTAAVAELTVRLAAARREHPATAELGTDGTVRHLASPISGPLNPIAPPITMTRQADGRAECEFTLSVVYEGPPGLVHGGVSALVLDHLCGAAAAANGTPGMTATLDIRYRRPTPYGVPLSAAAETVRVDGRRTYVEGRIFDPDGAVTVEATAMFIAPRWVE